MKQKMLLIALTIAIIAASLAICVTAQPPGYSTPPSPDGSQYSSYPPGYSGQDSEQYPPYPPGQGNYPSGQGNQAGQGSQNNQGASADHPTTGPQSQQPDYTPSASTGKVAENYGQGQSLTSEQVTQLGGETTGTKAGGQYQAYLVMGLEQWALYNGQWTKEPAAVYYNGKMNLLVYNDREQYLWSYEKYPNGYVDWRNWGYLYSGYYNRIFLGDAPGWHQIAVWGDQSGWSNVLWIYVYNP
jgi:hypothetical protein